MFSHNEIDKIMYSRNRDELNEIATGEGVEAPETFKNKKDVAKAILDGREARDAEEQAQRDPKHILRKAQVLGFKNAKEKTDIQGCDDSKAEQSESAVCH